MLRAYFDQLRPVLTHEHVWTDKSPALASALLTTINALDETVRQEILNDADRVGAMADEAGQVALLAVVADAESLEALPNGHARGVWLLLHDPVAFEHAEQARFTDDRRQTRMWDGFKCTPGRLAASSPDRIEAFKQALREYTGRSNVEIEMCDRSRVRRDKPLIKLVQAAVYHEGRAGERKAFVNGELDRLLDHPVLEAAITYESESGIIEVVAKERTTREVLVRLFAEHLLSTPFEGTRLPIRKYDLSILRRPFNFPTDPDDNIESVRVTYLRMAPFDHGGERVTLECMRGAQRDIWQMAHDRFAEHSPLHDGYSITQARFTVKFRSRPGAGRTLPIKVSMPQGCDLKDRTETEQLIGDKYLRNWGLLRDV